MPLKYLLGVSFCLVISLHSHAQANENYTWWNPATSTFPVLEGQAWPKEVKSFYDRLPARAASMVREAVWGLSKHSAGLYIKFKSNAGQIKVRYTLTQKNNYGMPHMPATGVSGVDLYALDHSGKWVWAPGQYQFSDTVTYQFNNIVVDTVFKDRDCEFRLFLPLYNAVSWMEIGIPAGNTFVPLPLSEEKPVVVYGTSIAQGGCASRPGLAWTSILERQLDYPLINLAFSGNGRLEKPLIDLMTEIDAKVYVLDCLPNLVGSSPADLESKIRESVKGLQDKRPGTPILLTEHSQGIHSGTANIKMTEDCEKASAVLRQTVEALRKEGVKNIHLLSNTAIGMDINATVDGIHPADIGMKQHADAYEKAIREIVQEPSLPAYSTTQPVMQDRDGYDWRARHAAILQLNKTAPPQNVIIANSIIHYWGGEPQYRIADGVDSWNRYMKPLGVRNMALGWDRIENALWRVYHGTLDGYTAEHVMLMIGTNNLGINTNEEIIAGLKRLVEAVQLRQPGTGILLSGIFPRRDMEKRVEEINREITKLATAMKVTYIDPGRVLLNASGKIDETLFRDGLHPNAAGYNKLAPVLAGYLKK
ncbi:MAG: SGNH/GDSL hydrolase family protein [Chitinophagaceae bacterium]|nr:SGNH/GDSL hydrolase family protein [Chitinophagaceae bacterium]MCW5927643.1 SGNH/GDSL hydrolase family protein [Chitinophagaceae bacterium]